MSRFLNVSLFAGLLSLAVAWPASAQFYAGSNNYAPASSQAYSRGLCGPSDPGGNLRSFSLGGGSGGFFSGGGGGGGSPYGATTPWSQQYGSYIQSANSGVTRDLISRQQNFYSGSMLNQDLKMRQLQLKQAAFDEMMYERMNTPPIEQVREQDRLERLTRARNTPPDNEIANGQALNDMLVNIQRIEAREGVRGYAIPLDPETLKNLNVTTTGDSRGSNEFFKTDSLGEWPVAFNTDAFAMDRKRVREDIAAMVNAQQGGRVDQRSAVDARKMKDYLKSKLFAMRFDLPFSDYSDGLGFLTKLEDTIGTLAKPGAKNFVDGSYAAKGQTVGELVDYMTSKGLKFAKASTGYEPYYLGFYQQMVTYDIGISRLVGDQSTMMYKPTPVPPSN